MDFARVPPCCEREGFAIVVIVLLAQEDRCAIVTSLNEMERNPG
jgi:hypothetical protein